jgi:hypothetical protein
MPAAARKMLGKGRNRTPKPVTIYGAHPSPDLPLTFPLPKARIEVCAKEVRNPICVVYNSV